MVPASAGLFSSSKDLLRESIESQKWTEVETQVKTLLSSNPSESKRDLFRLVIAIALHRQGKIDESIMALEPIKEASSYYLWAKLFLARLAYVSHNLELLELNLKALENTSLKGEGKLEKRFYDAQLLIHNRKWSAAERILKQIEKNSRGTELHVPVLEGLAQTQSYILKPLGICKTIVKIYSKYPLHPWFEGTGPEIKNIKLGEKQVSCSVTDKEFEQRRKTLNLLGEFKLAGDEINKWFALTGKNAKQQSLTLAQQFLAEGHPEKAIQILKEVATSEADLQILIPLSFAAARAGEMKQAIESSLLINKALGLSKQGTMALYQAGVWSYQIRDYESAETYLKRLNINRLSKAYRKEVQWYLSWLHYLKGDFVAAEKSFRAMQKKVGRRGAKDSPDRIQYWLAMSLVKQGKNEKARVLFNRLLAKSGMNYYSFLARERMKLMPDKNLVESGSQTPRVQLTVAGRSVYSTPFGEEAPWPTIQESESTEEEILSSENDEATLLAETEDAPEPAEEEKNSDNEESSAIELFSKGEANLKLERAKAFWSIGLSDLARREVSDLERYSRSFDLFRRVTDEYRQMGLYNKLSVLGQNFVGRANKGTNKFVYEAIYPRAYPDLVEKYATEHNVAQALVWGIMKAESMYRPWVKSPVGALGLMQVMPITGQKLGEMLEFKNFSPQVLLQPQEAIRFGSKYLERLGKKFDHSVQLVAAAYNAGPHRVSQWLYYFGYMQMDEWVEHIPFLETRNYVKKVTVNYMAYNELYGRSLGDSLALIEPVPVQIAGTPETKESWE
jgi:soluble lytic murein transglycosylase